MTITINLEPETEARLRQKAARAGRPAEQLAHDFVLRGVDEPDAEEYGTASAGDEPTLVELFAGRTGLVNSERRFNSSPQEPDQLAEESRTRPKQTLAEALAGRIGTQHSGRGDLSQNTGKAFARLLMEKHKADQE
jgi:plasmid stability protein